jgi:hypothetical protein
VTCWGANTLRTAPSLAGCRLGKKYLIMPAKTPPAGREVGGRRPSRSPTHRAVSRSDPNPRRRLDTLLFFPGGRASGTDGGAVVEMFPSE